MAIINLIIWKWKWRWLANVTWHLTCVWAIKGSGRNTKGTRITMNVLQYGRIRNWIVSIIPISVSKTNPKIRSIISLFIIGSPFFQQGFIILNWTNEPNIYFESNKVKWKKTTVKTVETVKTTDDRNHLFISEAFRDLKNQLLLAQSDAVL